MENRIGHDWRLATPDETAAAILLEGAPHVDFGCTCCGMVGWSAKNIALSANGRYNGMRRILPPDSEAECDCPAAAIRHVVPMA